MLIDTILQEREGQTLRAEVYSDIDGYNLKCYINGIHYGNKSFPGIDKEAVKEEALNWINGIKVLKG